MIQMPLKVCSELENYSPPQCRPGRALGTGRKVLGKPELVTGQEGKAVASSPGLPPQPVSLP